jgi:transcriptional regulator with XRE-family HTH domain
MSTRQRPADRGRQRGLDQVRTIGREIRLARRTLSLSLAAVGQAVGISATELSRIERGLAPWVSLVLLAQLCAVVGLDLSARAYPGGVPLRDARHGRLLAELFGLIHRSLRRGAEVPMPLRGDQRGWDGWIAGSGWRYGVEVELNPIDGQALLRRIHLKERDSGVNGVILVLPDTRQSRLFRRHFADLLAADFTVPGRRSLELLGAAADPGGSSVVVL